VVDNESGRDITSMTLSQPLVATERSNRGVPGSLLVGVVHRGGGALYGALLRGRVGRALRGRGSGTVRRGSAGVLAAALLALAAGASADPVLTATTSVRLHADVLEAATLVDSVAEVGSSTPYPGFDFGFPVTGAPDFDPDSRTGEIPHDGRLIFVGPIGLNVGLFELGYDAARVEPGLTSGYFLESTFGGDVYVAFDLAEGLVIETTPLAGGFDLFTIREADLLVSPELAGRFGSFLRDGVSVADFADTDLGDARVDAFLLPEPGPRALGAAVLLALGPLALSGRRARAPGERGAGAPPGPRSAPR